MDDVENGAWIKFKLIPSEKKPIYGFQLLKWLENLCWWMPCVNVWWTFHFNFDFSLNTTSLSTHLSEEPGELHALVVGVAAFQQSRSAVHVHQALVVVVVDGWTQASDMELLGICVVHVLQWHEGETLIFNIFRPLFQKTFHWSYIVTDCFWWPLYILGSSALSSQ